MTVQIDGNSGVSACQPNSVSQDDLQTGVVGKGSAFYVNTATFSPITGTEQFVTFTNKVFDTANAFTLATGVFKPIVPGYYQFNWSLSFAGSGLTRYFGDLFLNAAVANSGGRGVDSPPLSGTEGHSVGSALIFMNGTTDIVRLGNYAIFTTGITSAEFSGFLARAA